MKIDGLKLEISADEMLKHFATRLEHHKIALKKLETSPLVLVSKDGQMGKTEMMKLHKQQVRFLTFITTHMPTGDAFLLTMSECSQLMLLNEVTEYAIEDVS